MESTSIHSLGLKIWVLRLIFNNSLFLCRGNSTQILREKKKKGEFGRYEEGLAWIISLMLTRSQCFT